MPIPAFNENNLLPAGIHLCSLKEVGERFGRFQSTDRRAKLFSELMEFVKEASSTGLARTMIIDGSFVTGEAQPNDIDLILLLPEDFDFAQELPPVTYNVLSRKCVARRFNMDLFVYRDNSMAYHEQV